MHLERVWRRWCQIERCAVAEARKRPAPGGSGAVQAARAGTHTDCSAPAPIVFVASPHTLVRFARLANLRGGGAVVTQLYRRGQLRCRR